MRVVKYLIVILVSALLFTGLLPQKAYATDDSTTIYCGAEEVTWDDFAIEFSDLNVKRLVSSFFYSLILNTTSSVISGKDLPVFERCLALRANMTCPNTLTLDDSCDIPPSECEDVFFNMTDAGAPYNPNANVNTGLLGAVHKFEAAAQQDVVPVNLAYFFSRELESVPLAQRAFAQSDFRGPFLSVVYNIWRGFRDFALGVMGISVLIIAFMLITRFKVSPQASLTLQMALPRVVIAILLILFSYAIGATGATLAYTLRGSINSSELISRYQLFQCHDGSVMLNAAPSDAVSMVLLTVLRLGGAIIPIMIFGLLGLIIGLVFYALALIKLFIVYAKILVSIIVAPVTFAIGAIPGYENVTSKWFKLFFSRVIALPAMFLVIDLTVRFCIQIIYEVIFAPITLAGYGTGWFTIFLIPVFIGFGFNLARKLPDKFEEFFTGETGRRRR